MAQDIQDWTQAVNVTGGTVTISGTATVSIAGTPAVTISGTPSVSVSSGTVNIGNTPAVTISGTPTVILGGGTASIGSISAISSTVTVAGTINIGNTPAVTISGTPTVNIASGTVTIGGSPTVNVTAANGITIAGPNLLAAYSAGPIVAGWHDSGNAGSIVYNSDGTLTVASAATTGAGFAIVTPRTGVVSGPDAMVPVLPGQTYQVQAYVKALDANDTMSIQLFGDGAAGANDFFLGGPNTSTPVGTWVLLSYTVAVPPGMYYAAVRLVTGAVTIGDRYQVGMASLSNVGAFPMNPQQGAMPTTQPQVNLAQISSPGSGEGVTTLILPKGTQAIAIRLDSGLYAKYGHIIIRGHLTQPNTKTVYFTGYTFSQEIYSFPVLSEFDQQVEIALQNNDNLTVVTVEVVALLQSVVEFIELFPAPNQRPNQLPVLIDANVLTSGNIITLLSPIANVSYVLFKMRFNATQITYLTHGPTAAAGQTRMESTVGISGSQDFDLQGVTLPAGDGVYFDNESGATATISATLYYSKK